MWPNHAQLLFPFLGSLVNWPFWSGIFHPPSPLFLPGAPEACWQCGGGQDWLEDVQPAGVGPALLHPAGEEQRAGAPHLLEGLEVTLCRQVPQAGGVCGRCPTRNGHPARAAGIIICRGEYRTPDEWLFYHQRYAFRSSSSILWLRENQNYVAKGKSSVNKERCLAQNRWILTWLLGVDCSRKTSHSQTKVILVRIKDMNRRILQVSRIMFQTLVGAIEFRCIIPVCQRKNKILSDEQLLERCNSWEFSTFDIHCPNIDDWLRPISRFTVSRCVQWMLLTKVVLVLLCIYLKFSTSLNLSIDWGRSII